MRPFAFYGILREDPALAIAGEYLGDCRIPGRLWSVGLFPALTDPAGPGSVAGALWLPPTDDEAARLTVRALDALEGHTGDPATSMFVRTVVTLEEPAGVEAWVYVWAGGTEHLEPLRGGYWSAASGAATYDERPHVDGYEDWY